MSLARVITVVTAALLAVVASAASASASTAPDTWPGDEDFSSLQWIVTFIGGTVLLFAVIWIIAAAINAKSQHFVPAPPSTELETAPKQDVASH